MPKENFMVEFDIPEGINYKKARAHIPLIASNLLVATELIKIRMLNEEKTYTYEEVYKLAFDNFNFWMDLLSRSFSK